MDNMADPARAAKMADRIKVIVAKRLERGLKDPRIGFVTITDVRVTGDLQHASIFYTVYGTDEERADTAAALKSATGMLRSEVGKNITSRLTPSLEFIPDAIPENAELISSLLSEAAQRDAEVEALKANAQYAGDEDPYVKPREHDEGDEHDEDDDQ
jgi:ribosome-binding factor A